MDSSSDSEFGPEQAPAREIGSLPKPSRPRVILNDVVLPAVTTRVAPSQASPSVTLQTMEPQRVSIVAHPSIKTDPLVSPVRTPADSRSQAAGDSGLSGLYFLLVSAALMFCIWFIGPRLVEEYHYAAERGKSRANYEGAVEQLSQQPLANVSQAYQLVAQRIRPSVVSVTAGSIASTEKGLGSGVIMSTEGHVLTNAHVLENHSEFAVVLHDRRQFRASLVGIDTTSDLALLKINAPGLIPATWGDSDNINVGSIVWAIGSPYGFQQTVTSGIISGKDRRGDKRHPKQSLLQTDAAVNPGNSGGPLVDAQGRVIGINTSIFGETFQGISFAVPSETAKFVYQELLKNGNVTRGYLGVKPIEVDYFDATRMHMPDLDGAKADIVELGSPAYQAGIRRGDIIRSWGGRDVKEYNDLFRFAETARPNSSVQVKLIRDGTEHLTDVVLGSFTDPGMRQFYREQQTIGQLIE